MIRFTAVAFVLAVATSAQAMSPAPLHQPDSMTTQARQARQLPPCKFNVPRSGTNMGLSTMLWVSQQMELMIVQVVDVAILPGLATQHAVQLIDQVGNPDRTVPTILPDLVLEGMPERDHAVCHPHFTDAGTVLQRTPDDPSGTVNPTFMQRRVVTGTSVAR